jgi:alpha-L-rhamnosidase
MSIDDVECPFVHSETTQIGNFSSSNPIINQIQHNIQWGQLSNIMSVPTDWYVV